MGDRGPHRRWGAPDLPATLLRRFRSVLREEGQRRRPANASTARTAGADAGAQATAEPAKRVSESAVAVNMSRR